MGSLVTGAVRDPEGNLVATYRTSGRGELPASVTELLKRPGYYKEVLVSVDESDFYDKEKYLIPQRQAEYAAKLSALETEAKQRRDDEARKINDATARREGQILDVNVKNKMVKHTTNNPFVSPGAREISARKAKSAVASLLSTQQELDKAVDSYNNLVFEGAFEKYNADQATRLRNYNQGLSFKAGKDNKYVDYKNYTPPAQQEASTFRIAPVNEFIPSNEAKAKLDIEKYQNRNVQPQSAGFTITMPSSDRPLSRSEQTALNQSIINATVQAKRNLTSGQKELLDKGLLSVSLGFEKKVSETKSQSTPLASAKFIPPKNTNQTYVITDKNGNVQRQSNLTDAEIRAYQNIGSKVAIETRTEKYRVTTPEGKEIIFDTKTEADKFISGYGNTQAEIQGPVRPSGIAGSLVSIFGVEPEKQGPNLNEKAFFVGANAQGFTIDATRPIEPRITTSDLFGNNPLTMRLDQIYELNKPVSERSDVQRVGPGGFSNREIGELTAPLLNRLTEGKDTVVATGKALKGEKAFEWESGFLGVPVYAPIEKTKKIETTLDRLANGKPVNFEDKNERFSVYGSTLTFAGELYGFGAAAKGGTKAVEGIDLFQKTGSFTKAGAVKKAESLLSEGLISGFTKLDDDYYIIARGGGGKGTGVSTEVKPSITFEKIDDTVTARFSNVPKDVNVLQSGEKIAQQVDKINKEIEKLRVFTDKNRFDENLIQKTNQKITELENQRNALQNTPSLTTGEARYPVSIIEFGNTPKVTQIGKAGQIENTKIGSTIFVEGTVPRQQLLEYGLAELPKTASAEFGILTKSGQTNAVYQGIVTESNLPKLIAAEKLGYIKTVAEGKSAPLGALLKGRTDVLREYAGAKTLTTKIDNPIENIFSWKTFSRQPEIFDPFKVPKNVKRIEPEISLFSKTKPDEIRTPTEYGIVNKGQIRSGESRGVTGIGSKSLENFAQDMLNISEKASTPIKKKPFNFGIGESKGTAGSSGKGASISLDDAFGAAKSYIRANPVDPQDILFSGPRGLLPQYHGIISDNALAYPQDTPERIKNQIKIEIGLDTRVKSKTAQAGEGDYFERFGLKTIGQTKKEFEEQNVIDVFVQTSKERSDLKSGIISITGLGQTPITGLDTTPIQGQKTTPITDLITDPFTDIITDPIPERPGTGFGLGEFGIAFPGFGGSGDNRYRRKKGKKKYIVSSIDPLTPGSIETAGVKQQQVSSKKTIYGKIDVDLGKARKRNQPKERKRKDPFKL